MKASQLDQRIGILSSGEFYAYAHGYEKPATVGTLEEVENALGIISAPVVKTVKNHKTFDVVMRFAYPAWDEVDGISYPGIRAYSKSDANNLARKLAERDGHAIGGRGRYTFTAVEV